MKKYLNKSLSETISSVGSMLLFMLFAGCTLMIIAVAASTYSRISDNFDKTFGASAALRYISNKIKSSESAEIINGGDGIKLESGSITNVICFYDGGLYENSMAADSTNDYRGEKIFDLNGLEITSDGAWYKITVVLNGEQSSTFVRRGDFSEVKT